LAETQKELDQAKKSASQVADLQKQNKDLSDQLVATKKEAASKNSAVVAALSVDNTQTKKLQSQAESARADLENARKTVADLQKQNTSLRKQLAAAKKQAAEEEATETDWTKW